MDKENKNVKNMIKEYRDKNEYYSQKIKEQENKEKNINYNKLNKNYSPLKVTEAKKERLPTIQERETENFSIKPITEEKEIDHILKKKIINSGNNQSNCFDANANKMDSRDKFEKSLKFDVTIPSNHESPSNSNNLNEIHNNKSNLENDNNFRQNNNNIKNKTNHLVINSINDTIDQKNNNSLRKPYLLNEKQTKHMINSISDTLTEQRNINLESIKHKNKQLNKNKEIKIIEKNSTEIDLIEESLVKSLNSFNKQNEKHIIFSNKDIKKKSSIKHQIYNGLIDRVSSYNFVSKEWSKNAFLSNKTRSPSKLNTNYSTDTFNSQNDANKKEKRINHAITQKVRNIRRPISFYKKF